MAKKWWKGRNRISVLASESVHIRETSLSGLTFLRFSIDCGKEFSWKSYLDRHTQIHSGKGFDLLQYIQLYLPHKLRKEFTLSGIKMVTEMVTDQQSENTCRSQAVRVRSSGLRIPDRPDRQSEDAQADSFR